MGFPNESASFFFKLASTQAKLALISGAGSFVLASIAPTLILNQSKNSLDLPPFLSILNQSFDLKKDSFKKHAKMDLVPDITVESFKITLPKPIKKGPIKISQKQKIVSAYLAKIALPPQRTESEKMQDLHRKLRSRFFEIHENYLNYYENWLADLRKESIPAVAVGIVTKETTKKEVAVEKVEEPVLDSPSPQNEKKSSEKSLVGAVAQAKRDSIKKTENKSDVAERAPSSAQEVTVKSTTQLSIQTPSVTEYSKTELPPQTGPPDAEIIPDLQSWNNDLSSFGVIGETQPSAQNISMVSSSSTENNKSFSEENEKTDGEYSESGKKEISILSYYQAPVAVSTQVPSPKEPPVTVVQNQTKSKDPEIDQQNLGLTKPSDKVLYYIEAFTKNTLLFPPETTVLSQEGTGSNQIEWWVAKKEGYVKTLYLRDRSEDQKVPVLHKTTLPALLTKQKGTIIQGTSVVYGSVARGWKMSLSARSDGPLKFGEELPLRGDPSEDSFLYWNVEPGVHILKLENETLGKKAAVPVFAFPDQALFLDLTRFESTYLEGTVLAASAENAPPLSGVQVQVIGYDLPPVFTTEVGRFHFPFLMSVGHYPFFVDTEAQDGMKHRYKIQSSQKTVKLYRFEKEEIRNWSKELQGGVNRDSGYLIAGFHKNSLPNEELDCFTEMEISSEPLEPETYHIGGDLHLQSGLVKNAGRTRTQFFSVQIPDGLGKMSCETSDGKVIGSELFVPQANAVHLIGQ